jgi:hypothetical protein
MIVQVGVVSILAIVGVRLALVSYFNRIHDEETYVKVGSVRNEELVKLREQEKAQLQSGAMPIEKSMALLTKVGRTGQGTDAIGPQAAKDNDALVGWKLLPRMAAPPPVNPPTPAPAPEAAVDGGAAEAQGDGGVTPTTAGPDAGPAVTGDAGAPHSTPADAGSKTHP